MTPERFRQVEVVFDAVADAVACERAAILERLTADDPALRREVESLLVDSPGVTAWIGRAIASEATLVSLRGAARWIDDRYEVLEKLGEGGMGVVYCARDRLTGRRVALKRVHVAGPTGVEAAANHTPLGPAPAVMALAREFRTLASLRHPHIISVLDYGFGPTREPFLTMELLVGARPLLAATFGRPIAERVRFLLQVLAALTYLHRRGVLHRDLKPANVLVVGSGDEARVKVLDFGIAYVRDPAGPAEALAGTIGYMAPELFGGSPPNEAADLWAVAVMAHEVLAGRHPYAERGAAGVLSVLAGEGALFVDDAGLAPALAEVLRRALSRSPAERHEDAAAFACDLARAVGLPPPAEGPEIRDSFLSSAAFVAREAEMATLRRALDDAHAGRGSLWLVGGESGVGKSRLLDELRTVALVRGTRVVRGQAVAASGAAYQVWRDALRPLCLDAGLDDLDAGVLRAAVPDLAALLERSIPDPPEVDPQRAETRLLVAVERLLHRQRAPFVIILEDLHWADPASVVVLQRLARSVTSSPWLVIASYRDDERRGLPDELPGAERLALPRLTRAEVAQLCGSMLGEVGTDPALVSLLARETEGNALFVVEAVRSLAEEAGALARIGARGQLPAQVAAGGIQAVLRRRLARVPAPARALLTAAAVFGRELDLRVLAVAVGERSADIEADLAACTASAVLEVKEDTFRFSHDRLRGELLTALPEDERATWHGRIGEAIERVHAEDLDPHAAALAHHYAQAQVPRREAHFRVRAGELAGRGGAVSEAVVHLERARALFDRLGVGPLERARALGLLSRAYHAADRFEEALEVLGDMFADLGHAMPRSRLGLAVHIGRRLGQHALARLSPAARPRERDPRRLACAAEIGAVVLSLPGGGLVQTPAQMLATILDCVVMAERARDPVLLISAYMALRMLLSVSPLSRLSDDYRRLARAAEARLPEARVDVRAYVDTIEAAVHVHRGEWEAALARVEAELGHRRRMGDWRGELAALMQGHFIALYRGDLAGALDYLRRFEALELRLAEARMSWSVRHQQGHLALRRGALDEAARRFAEIDAQLAQTPDPHVTAYADSAMALCKLRQGERLSARRRADAALDRMLMSPPIHQAALENLSAVLEVHIDLWSSAVAAADAERSALATRVEQGLAVLRRFGVSVRIARPRAFLWHGLWAAARGRPRLAAWHLEKALAAAERYRMPFDEALVRVALARLADPRDRERGAEQLRIARDIFMCVGAQWYIGTA